MGYHLNQRRFPLALDLTYNNLLFANEPVDNFAFADCADQNYVSGEGLPILVKRRVAAAHSQDVRLQITGRAHHAGIVAAIHIELCCGFLMHQPEAVRVRDGLHIAGLSKRHAMQREEDWRKQQKPWSD